MRLTIIYDNETTRAGLKADWGFSCLVEAHGRRILFDTGANGAILLGNMRELGIEPASVEEVVISHNHWDHTGGLADFLAANPCKVWAPASLGKVEGAQTTVVKDPVKLHDGIASTGELEGVEQSLVVDVDGGVAVVAGCSHPSVGKILEAASAFGKVRSLIGGLHGFDEFDRIADLDTVCATHCTQHKRQIKSLYPDKYVEGGAGVVLEI
jgi:7,8-dihydropterin-6-yl-methyl-4-(beta-D-ribofuranosyl)aminobenzene 5'-phosphate synthase